MSSFLCFGFSASSFANKVEWNNENYPMPRQMGSQKKSYPSTRNESCGKIKTCRVYGADLRSKRKEEKRREKNGEYIRVYKEYMRPICGHWRANRREVDMMSFLYYCSCWCFRCIAEEGRGDGSRPLLQCYCRSLRIRLPFRVLRQLLLLYLYSYFEIFLNTTSYDSYDCVVIEMVDAFFP